MITTGSRDHLDVLDSPERATAQDGPTPQAVACEPRGDGPERAELLAVPPVERPGRLMAVLGRLAARVLGHEGRQLAADRPLVALGLDSLGAAELAAAIEAELGIEVSMAGLLDGPSLRELAGQLLALLSPAPGAAAAPPAPVAASAGRAMPLSHGQRALWFLDRMAPGNPAHVIAGAARVRGELDAARLELALRDLVMRHPSLRTTFELRGEAVVQLVRDQAVLAFAEEDATGWSEERLAARLLEEAWRPFDLTAGPLLRVALFRRSGCAGEHRLVVLAVHHLVADFWSLGVLLDELGALWNRRALPRLSASYGDFVRRQEELLAGPEGERLWSYWRAALPPGAPPLELPTDRPRPAQETWRGGSRALRLDHALANRLGALGSRAAATPFMTLLAAFMVLLHRHSGQDTLLVGTPAAGRGAAEWAGVVGYFVNPVVVVGDLRGAPTFAELLGRVRAAAVAAIAHQDFPFPLLVERLGVSREPGRSPIFQAMFVFYRERRGERGLGGFALREGGAAVDLGGLILESVALPRQSAQFDLALLMTETGGGMSGLLQYNGDLFDAATVARMASQLGTLLAGVAGALGAPGAPEIVADLRLHDLPLLSPGERHQLVLEWSSTSWQAGGDDLLHAPFERQAARNPAAIALCEVLEEAGGERGESGALSLSYGELDGRASRLAAVLRAHGAGPERLVGICAEPSFAMMAGLLAILKAGSAYLPLDPALPVERLAQVLTGSGARLVLAEERFAERLERLPVAVLTLRRDAGIQAADASPTDSTEPAPPGYCTGPALPACPDNPAYVLYTSGSTGAPKGVAVSHRAAVNRMRFQLAADLAADARVLQRTHLGFDVSIVEMFAPLWAGATVVLARAERRQDAAYLARLVADQQVTNVNAPPALLPALLAEAAFRECRSLRRVVTGGERVPADLPRRFFSALTGGSSAAASPPQLIARYGLTETTISVAEWICRPDAGPAGQSVPLGRPIAGARFHVLGRAQREVPPGVPGELCIAGVCLARGYLGQPELTAAAFRPDPFAPGAGEPGGRLYRTGDLVRHRADGVLEFLGRVDRQVKIRGFRLEPGEVEAVLTSHPEVGEAAVVDREETATGGRKLVAYVVPRATGAAVRGGLLSRRLRAFLAARLPGYMVPSAVMVLASLPLTPNGKLDRAALSLDPGVRSLDPDGRGAGGAGGAGPAPGEDGRETAAPDCEASGPRRQVEELLAGIWSQLLGIERVGSEDSFFDLGGHSLLATQLLSRIRGVLGVELALREVFELPVLAKLAARIEELLAAGAAAGAGGERPITRAPRGLELPLSFAQERLWFLAQLAPGSAVYHLPALLRLRGELRPAALAAAFAEVVRRHEALRTRFGNAGGRPVQEVAAPDPGPFPMGLVDLAALPGPRREPELLRQARRQVQRPFDLARGPLLRVQLLRLAAADHGLLFVAHHIAGDGWSIAVLTRELAALYAAAIAGQPSPLPELPVQYADFACWQRAWLAGGALDEQLGWWRRRLDGMPAALELPADRPLPAAQDFRGARRKLQLPRELTDALRAACRRLGVTSFMAQLAAFQALLGRHTGQRRLVVGTPIANRNRAETEGLIGFFVNLLALPGDLEGDPSWRDLLGRAREVCLGAYARQDLPFEKLVEQLAPRRDLAHSPLFQALLVLQNAPREDLKLPGLEISAVEMESGEARFELSLTVLPAGDDLAAALAYRTALFDGATAARMLAHWQRLLTSMAQAPESLVWEAPLLAEAETAQLLREWNDTERGFPGAPGVTGAPAGSPHPCLHVLFEAQARRTPGAAAVRCEGELLTYRELDRRAECLASRLREAGIGPEIPVGLLAEPSVAAIAGLLGVLKAGGAYVPLDPAAPAERLAAMIADAAMAVVLTRGDRPAGLPGNVQTIDLEAPEPGGAPPMPTVASVAPGGVAAEGLAYVLYTSGSTGRPKGVAVAHGPAVNYVLAIAERLGLTPGAAFAMVQPLTVDSCVTAIFPPLVTGGCLHVIPRQRALDAAALEAAFERQPIDCLKIAPSHLAALLSGSGSDRLLPRRWLIVGGEPSQLAWLCRLREAAPECAVFNHYGPTEATVGMLMHRVSGPRGASFSAAAPVGRPIANTVAYLLDERRLPVPLGSRGTLYIGGDCLARGYLGRPEATAERFVPDPYARRPGARLYDSGDVMRSTPAGELVFLGRLDQQVKIRGFRVELGEIAAAVARHPGVAEAVVRTWEEAPGRAGLVAYVVAAAGGAAPTLAELRRFLAARLPEHMAPSAVMALTALPRTPHGKLDAKALPAPAAPAAPAEVIAEPLSPVAELLAGLWDSLLGRGVGAPRASSADNFFELGGHSLLATQLLSRIRGVFAVGLPLREIFEHPTLGALAARIAAAKAIGSGAARPAPPPLVRGSRQGPLPLSFAQQRLWFLDQLEPGSALYNVPAAFAVAGPLDLAALRRSLGEIVRRHEVLHTRFQPLAGGEPVQVILPWSAAHLRLPVADLEALPPRRRDEEAKVLAEREAEQPFQLLAGGGGARGGGGPETERAGAPLLRLVLARLGAERHVLVTTMHHIVSDGWSREIFSRELAELYQALAAGRPSPLPEPPIQYADFACWQRGWLSGGVLAAELEHWRGRLAGAPPVHELPADRPRPAVRSHRGARRRWSPPAAIAAAAAELARREGVTRFMALLASLQAVLARGGGQDDVSVGTPIAGRNRLETEGLIGFFVNTLVLRTDLSGDPSFGELLRRVREVALEAFLHQDLPFEKLVAELAPRRSLSHTPLFQVVFALQNAPRQEREAALPGWRPSPLAVNGRTAKFDLTVALLDRGGELTGGVEYATDLFDAATIARLCGHWESLLAAATADPGARLSAYPRLSPAETHQVTIEWNDGSAGDPAPPASRLAHRLFAAQAGRTPDAVALRRGAERLTFGELRRRASRLARRLRAAGVGPEAPVGILLPLGPGAVVAILGVLEAGGAYVPLDPAWPRRRLASLLDDCQASVVVADRRLVDLLPGERRDGARAADPAISATLATLAIIAIDGDSGAPLSLPGSAEGERAWASPCPANLAYILYTSGSSGQPKGVMVSHGALANYLQWSARSYLGGGESAGRGAPLHSPLTFDLTVTSVFAPLLAGQEVTLVPTEEGIEGLGLALRDGGFGFVKLTPAHLDLLQHLLAPADVRAAAGALVIGGEQLHGAQLGLWRDQAPETRVVNEYGPTETVVGCCVYEIPAGRAADGPVPIGRPIANTRLYLLDGACEPVGTLTPGELFIGGAGVARGYLGRPDLTAERFVPDAVSKAAGARLYRTGDLCRYRPDGNLEFLGRADLQVKLRGFRIELGEIEAALLASGMVKTAAVSIRDDGRLGRRLVAHVVPAPGTALEAGTLRASLRERLPDYMVPASFRLLPALPLTPNGKVDRRLLAGEIGRPGEPADTGGDPDGAPFVERAFAPPRSREEIALAGIWAEVLGSERVGTDDNFFALGGDSMLSIQVRSRAAEQGIGFSLQQLFRHQTIRELLAALGTVDGSQANEPSLPSQPFGMLAAADRAKLPAGVEDAYPIAALQLGMLFHSEFSPESMAYHNVGSARVRVRVDERALAAAVRALLARHPVLRTSFHPTGFGEPLQLVHREVGAPLVVHDLRGLGGAAQEKALADWFEQASRDRFDVSRAPLLRFEVHLLGTEEIELGWLQHHAILDGWSVASMMADLFDLYLPLLDPAAPGAPGAGAGRPAPPALFRTFVALEREATASAECRRFWQDRTAEPVRRTLPSWTVERDGEAAAGQGVEKVVVPLAADLCTALGSLAAALSVPLKSVLLAAHLKVCSWACGQQDVVTGLVTNGRPEVAGGDRALGLFLNTLPFGLRLSPGTWSDLVRRTFDAELELMPYRRFPLARIAELRRGRDGGRPLFETAFTYVHFHTFERVDGLAGVEIAGTRFFGVTNFPLDVTFAREPDGSGMQLVLKFDRARLEPAQVMRLARCYDAALEALAALEAPAALAAAAAPESQAITAARHDQCPGLTEAERHQLALEWNESSAGDQAPPLPAARGRGAAPPAAPRDPLEAQLVQVWEEVLGTGPLGIADSFFDLGGHSLLAVRLMATLEERFGRRLPISVLFQAATIERLAAVLRSGPERPPRSMLVEIQAGGAAAAAPPFFCVHPIGGDVLCYRDLARCLGSGRAFYGLQAPDLDSGRRPFASIGEMAHHYLESLRASHPHGPYRIGGWSMGAAVAFEMARQLAAQDAAPEALVLIDPPDPPDAGARARDLDQTTLTAWFLEDVANLGIDLSLRREDLRRLGQAEVVRLACAAARQAGLPPAAADAARLTAQLERIKWHSQLLLRYVPEPYPFPLTIFKTRRRSSAAIREAWRTLAKGGLEVGTVPGNHYTLLRPPRVAELARQLSKVLDRAQPAAAAHGSSSSSTDGARSGKPRRGRP